MADQRMRTPALCTAVVAAVSLQPDVNTATQQCVLLEQEKHSCLAIWTNSWLWLLS